MSSAHPAKRYFALLSPRGTACSETTLGENDSAWRANVEQRFCRGGPDDPVPGTWTDVTDNDACNPDTPF